MEMERIHTNRSMEDESVGDCKLPTEEGIASIIIHFDAINQSKVFSETMYVILSHVVLKYVYSV